MKKNIYLLLTMALASCQIAGTNVAIRSATQPLSYDETSYEEQYTENIEEIPTITTEEIQQIQETTTVVETPTPSMIDEVNSVNKTQDINNTNFLAMGTYKIGNPYVIDGVTYYPHEDYSYSEIGMASWYGPDFHGGKTSNGEIFDETKFTAAHRTLPMPSLVRVTNLENGVSINVKVNDRGPYARDRIIDLSSAAAEVLDIKEKGTARVKVEILPEESKKLKELAINSQDTNVYPTNIAYSSFTIQQDNQNVTPAQDATAQNTPQNNEQTQVHTTENKVVEENKQESQPTQQTFGDYYVQVAAYYTYDKAEELKDKLINIGTVKIFKSIVNGNTLYKVRLGEYATKEDAEKAKAQVDALNIEGSRVILKEDGSFKWDLK